MVAYSFQKIFAEQIRFGFKPHTMRAPRAKNRHARPKEKLQLYVGMRTKHVRKILDYDPICREVLPVSLRFELPYHVCEVRVDGQPVDPRDFAMGDGFLAVRSRAKGAWMPDGRAKWVTEPDDVMGIFWRYAHPGAVEAGRWDGQLIRWRPCTAPAGPEDYARRFGAPIHNEIYETIAAEVFGPSTTDRPVDGLPATLPDVGVR